MIRSISTYVFLPQRLHAGLLDALVAGGAQSIELFAARHHFDYTDRAEMRELAHWFRNNDCRATLHQPIFDTSSTAAQWSKHVPANLNLIDPDKSRRISAMDEVKRSMETAEHINIDSIVLQLGTRDDRWNERSLDLSLTAVEHLKAFAHPLGMKTLVETMHNEVTTPEHLMEILKIGHLDSVNVCLDVGHMNLPGMPPVTEAFAILGKRLRAMHLHDNGGERDEHCWPGDGTIDWKAVGDEIAKLPQEVNGTLEPFYEPEMDGKTVSARAAQAFRLIQGEA